MYLNNYIRHTVIQPFTKQIEAGDYLFRQGEAGSTMFVILDGVVQLYDETGDTPTLIGTYGPGQFFGEKSVLGSANFQRFFSAQAKLRTLLLEFSLVDIPKIQFVIPDFMVMLFQSATQKLDNAYTLIRLLQSQDDMQRLIHCIVYFYRCPGLAASANRFVSITAEDIHQQIRMDKKRISRCLDELANKNILTRAKQEGHYTLKDERALLAEIDNLKAIQDKAA